MSIALLLAAAIAAAPAHPATYPAELQGAWLLGTGRCRLPVDADANSDGLIVVERRRIGAYESSFSAYSIRRVSARPAMWRLDEFEDYEGETRRLTRVIKLGRSGSTFTSTEDGSTQTYTRCSGRLPAR